MLDYLLYTPNSFEESAISLAVLHMIMVMQREVKEAAQSHTAGK